MDKYSPRPEIERHYHIDELITNQERRVADRNLHREKGKEREERESLIKDGKSLVLTDFWCESCQKDFRAEAVKQIEEDWSNVSQRISFYRTKCWCGRWCLRLVTDKWRDAFWFKSKAVRVDRARNNNDMIQPHETGFNLLYGKK